MEKIPTIEYSHLNYISDGQIVYIKEINQYYTKFNGIPIFGNIGNIYDNKLVSNKRINAHQTITCKFGNSCHNVINEKYCKFWHNPRDIYELYKAGKISDKYYRETIHLKRNFVNTAWLYNTNAYNINSRVIGNKATLLHDNTAIKHIRSKIKENLEQQLMHDILVFLYIQ